MGGDRCPAVSGPAALVFPGVGVRLCGRERAFYHAHADRFAPLFEATSGYCGVDLAALLLEDRVDDLADGKRQFFTYAFSAGVADVARSRVEPRAAAGYSFGVYAALYAAEVFSFDAGLRIIDAAHRVMQEISARGAFGMGVVVGLDAAELLDIIRQEALGSVIRTNTNHKLCHIFSGRLDEIRRFLEGAEAAGAFRFQRLEVEIPYHHPDILAEAPERFRRHLREIEWRPATFPVVSTIDGRPMTAPEEIVAFTAEHLARPISWQTACEALGRLGIETALECGPGISLTQNARFIDLGMRYLNVKKALRCPAG